MHGLCNWEESKPLKQNTEEANICTGCVPSKTPRIPSLEDIHQSITALSGPIGSAENSLGTILRYLTNRSIPVECPTEKEPEEGSKLSQINQGVRVIHSRLAAIDKALEEIKVVLGVERKG